MSWHPMRRRRFEIAVLLVLSAGGTAGTARGAYTVERVVAGLNQPTFVTQAPNDNSSLYIVERSDTGNQLGRIRKYDLQSHTSSTFLDLSGSVVSDGGVLSMTFHPNFQSNGLFYVVSNNSGTNGLDEYKVVGGTPQFQRRLLQYQNLNNVYHTMNQAQFRPNGNNNELFVTTGDGGTQADDPGFNKALIESPTSPYGKMMKIDLSASFPSPATGPGQPGVSLFATGLRNPFRTSFDRQTGDFYIGDVGFNTAEEVDYIPASKFTNPQATPLDFGWTDREGTIATISPYAGGPGSAGDINPIFDYSHAGNPLPHPSVINGQTVTGGYLYRGPVTELQGRYFFSDFSTGNVYSGAFNTNTNPSAYNGTNLTGVQNHTTDFETKIGGGADIQFVTSFGEDNAGNLYIVKFGNSFFPALGQGEIFRVVPVAPQSIQVSIDRTSGIVTLSNATGAPISFSALTLTSPTGAINASQLTPITGHYDALGNHQIDNNDSWHVTSPGGSHTLFSEATTGDAGSMANGTQFAYSLAGGWIQSPTEDLTATILLPNGTPQNISVTYTGNLGHAFSRSDLDFNGTINAADWSIFLSHAFKSLAGLSVAQSYGMGDLDGDGDNDYDDFVLFKSDYNAFNGSGGFDAMLASVPEPSTVALAAMGMLMIGCLRYGWNGRARDGRQSSSSCC